MDRPGQPTHICTTPSSEQCIALLGSGLTHGSVALSRDELSAVRRLYGYTVERPRERPPEPPRPGPEPSSANLDEKFAWRDAVKAHEAWRRWEDTSPFMQAGADRNAMRYAEVDGLRLLAWIARFVPPGGDPLKTLVQLAGDAGWDVDPLDSDWSEAE